MGFAKRAEGISVFYIYIIPTDLAKVSRKTEKRRKKVKTGESAKPPKGRDCQLPLGHTEGLQPRKMREDRVATDKPALRRIQRLARGG